LKAARQTTKSTLTLDRLEKAGYIRREPNPADRRSLLIKQVPMRLREVAAMYEGIESETRRLLATLPQSDLEAVVRFFETLGACPDGYARAVHSTAKTLESAMSSVRSAFCRRAR
jgi:DNA-binding MarR family transcriptional regulator